MNNHKIKLKVNFVRIYILSYGYYIIKTSFGESYALLKEKIFKSCIFLTNLSGVNLFFLTYNNLITEI